MIGQVTSEILDKLLAEINKKENIEKIQTKMIDPLIHHTLTQLYPYIIATSIIFILIFILSITILFLLLKFNWSKVV